MSKLLATVICISVISFLLYWEKKRYNPKFSIAIWIAFIWILFTGTRPFSFWLNYFFGLGSFLGSSVEVKMEGNIYERIFLLWLMFSSIIILLKRRTPWAIILNENKLILAYFLFGLASLIWSDYPEITFRRWFKSTGAFLIVMLIKSEPHPYFALNSIIRRMAYITLPLSILFIKYFPEIGRAYHHSSGLALYTGVTDQKNSLGRLCLVFFIFFAWEILFVKKALLLKISKMTIIVYSIIFSMIIWLLYMSNSATSIFCVTIAFSIFIFCRSKYASKNKIILIRRVLLILVLFVVLEIFFNVSETIIGLLGRKTDLTTRVPMWEDLISMVGNPLFGYGFESFLLGDRLKMVVEKWGIDSHAHNGYLQLYLDTGFIGVTIIILWIANALKDSYANFDREYESAVLRLCILIIITIYNYTEATFYGVSNMWLLLLFCVYKDFKLNQVKILKTRNPMIDI